MKIIFWGTPEYSVTSLKNLIDSNNEILAVITQPDKKRARGSKLIPSPIKALSNLYNIPVICPEKLKNNSSFISELKSFKSDLFIVIAYGKILTKEILEIPKFGSWNAHASLLPRWRGAAPIHWSLLYGDKKTGVCIMHMEEGLDTGDILIEDQIEIENTDNLDSLSNKLSNLSSKLILKAIDLIEINCDQNKLKLLSQLSTNRKVKYARMISKNDYFIDFNDDAKNINRKINGLYPNAYIKYKNRKLKILKINIINKIDFKISEILSQFKNNKTGIILGIIKNEGIIISTNTKPILILEIKIEGKKNASGNNLIQQIRPVIGEKFN